MARVRFRKKINIGRVITKVVTTALVLYVGGLIMTQIGSVVNGTTSPFNVGYSLIGWDVTSAGLVDATSSPGTGLLSVVGVIGFASVVLEFVEFRLK